MGEVVAWGIAAVCTLAMVAAAVPVVRHTRAVRREFGRAGVIREGNSWRRVESGEATDG
jgi:hypothetical protein